MQNLANTSFSLVLALPFSSWGNIKQKIKVVSFPADKSALGNKRLNSHFHSSLLIICLKIASKVKRDGACQNENE